MSVDTRPIEVESVREEERLFGGDVVWWILLLIVSVPILLWGLSKTPDTIGFLLLSIGGIAAGLAFAQIVLRLPYFTGNFWTSVLISIVVLTVIGIVALGFNMTLAVPSAPPDVLYKPAISGG
jgi:hypothetical protein